jgi:hypothetical protein
MCCLTSWLVACGGATHGEVQHPKAGEKGTAAYCSNNAPAENTCMHCASKPGCGWCDMPNRGAPECQPGITGDAHPNACVAELSTSTESCAAPPPSK